MHSALALAPLTLVAVLALSGLAKMSDPRSTHSMMRLLRLPAPVASEGVARLVPWAELAIAALLLTPWRWTFAVGALAAVLLFLTFWVIIARAMTFDPRPTCGCFGRVGDHRINGRTVARNTILVALALVTAALALQGRSATGLLAGFGTGDWLWLLLAVALAAVAVFVLGGPGPSGGLTRRQQRDLDRQRREQEARRSAAAGPGDEPEELDYMRRPVPRGVLLSRDDEAVELQHLPRARAQLLVLVNCWCGPTHAALERLPRWREQLPELDVQMVFGPRPFGATAVPDALPGIWWDPGHRVYEALEVGASPGAVLLGADGLTAGGPVNGIEEIETFVSDIAAQLEEARAQATQDGAAAPAPGSPRH